MADLCNNAATLASLQPWLPLLTPIFVVGGWVVVYRLQALQVRRKHIREAAEKLRDAVNELRVQAITFHTSEFDASVRREIIIAFTQIERRYELFPQMASGKSECSMNAVDPGKVTIPPNFIINLRRAVTSEHFDGDTEPLKHDDPQVLEITSAAQDLIAEIDRVIVSALD